MAGARAGRVERLAPGGAGVVRFSDGAMALVPGVATGELVDVREASGRGDARGAELLRVVEPSADRVAPPCPFVAACGGCDWMHLREGAQLREHAAIVREVLAHALKRDDLPEITSHAASRSLGYRVSARLAISSRGGQVKVGYRAAGSREVASVSRCIVLAPALEALPEEIAEVLRGARTAGEARVAIGERGRPVVAFSLDDLKGDSWARIDARVKDGAWAGATVKLADVSIPAAFGDARSHFIGADGAPLVAPSGGFAQPSDEAFAALARRVAELAAPGEAKPRVLELFSGSGALSVALVPRSSRFASVELDAASVVAARENLAARGLSGSLGVGDANAAPIKNADVVVLDPPRTGAFGAAKALAASKAKAIVYVSCDPPTLARDAAVLAQGGFVVTAIETWELFPQTSHVETVACFVRSRG